MPRFRTLKPSEVAEKSPGDLVTIADTEAEREIVAALRAGNPRALAIGEEAVAADPSLRALIDDAERVWLVDSVDGTRNFVAGTPDFGCMVVELHAGKPVRSWIWQAAYRRMFETVRGGGVHLGGRLLSRPPPQHFPLVGAATADYALTDPGLPELWPMTGSCAMDYPLIALGRRDYMIHNRNNPWDHWPGILLLTELGGRVAFLDGEPFSSSSHNQNKILAARSTGVWQTVAATVRDMN